MPYQFDIKISHKLHSFKSIASLLKNKQINILAIQGISDGSNNFIQLTTNNHKDTGDLLSSKDIDYIKHEVLKPNLPNYAGMLAGILVPYSEAEIKVFATYMQYAKGNVSIALTIDGGFTEEELVALQKRYSPNHVIPEIEHTIILEYNAFDYPALVNCIAENSINIDGISHMAVGWDISDDRSYSHTITKLLTSPEGYLNHEHDMTLQGIIQNFLTSHGYHPVDHTYTQNAVSILLPNIPGALYDMLDVVEDTTGFQINDFYILPPSGPTIDMVIGAEPFDLAEDILHNIS